MSLSDPRGRGVPPPPPDLPPAARATRASARPAIVLLVLVVVLALGAATAILAGNSPASPASPASTDTAALPSATAGASPTHPRSSLEPSSTATVAPSGTSSPTVSAVGSAQVKEPPPTSAAPEDLTGYVWPLPDARVTSRFGPRSFGGFVVVDGNEIHDGLDLATYCGNKVRSAHDGTVVYAGRRFDDHMGYLGSGSGVYQRLERQGRLKELPIVVVIDDGNGYRSVYVHLAKALVEKDQVVKAGEVIGLEGMTGYATGCHLHYSLIRMDGPWQIVVPELHPYGYPAFVRERVNPLLVLPRDDPDAPARFREKSASPAPSATPDPAVSPAAPSPSPVPSP